MGKFLGVFFVVLLVVLMMCCCKFVLSSDNGVTVGVETGFERTLSLKELCNYEFKDDNAEPKEMDQGDIEKDKEQEWSDDDEGGEDLDVNSGKLWSDNDKFTKHCPFDSELDEELNDDEANTIGMECDYSCRANQFAYVGRCNRKNKCQCCGAGHNDCSTETAIWVPYQEYEGDCEHDIPDQEQLVGSDLNPQAVLNWECDQACVDDSEATVGVCFNAHCECCTANAPLDMSITPPPDQLGTGD